VQVALDETSEGWAHRVMATVPGSHDCNVHDLPVEVIAGNNAGTVIEDRKTGQSWRLSNEQAREFGRLGVYCSRRKLAEHLANAPHSFVEGKAGAYWGSYGAALRIARARVVTNQAARLRAFRAAKFHGKSSLIRPDRELVASTGPAMKLVAGAMRGGPSSMSTHRMGRRSPKRCSRGSRRSSTSSVTYRPYDLQRR